MKHWSLRQRILGSFALILALMTLMAGIGHYQLTAIDAAKFSVQRDALPGLYYSTMIRSAMFQEHMLVQQLAEVDSTAQERKADFAKLQANTDRLGDFMKGYDSTIYRADDRANFEAFKVARARYLEMRQAVFALDPIKQRSEIHQAFVQRLIPEWERNRLLIQRFVEDNRAFADQSTNRIGDAVSTAKISMIFTLLVALACAMLCGYLLMRTITQPMKALQEALNTMRSGDLTQRLTSDRRDEFGQLESGFNQMADELTHLVGQSQTSALQVSASITEIAATSKQQQATATETASTTAEIGATSQEILATSQELMRTMGEVSAVSEQAADLAGNGQASLVRMENTMQNVMEAAGSVNAKLGILSEKAGKINQIVTTITKVADQTNLLSLNAAIEAEKAGEYGRGFSVVATEIRRLADQTAVATYDIEMMVREILSAVSAGVMGMDKFSEEVRRGMAEVQQASGQLSLIIQQVQAMAPGFQQVNEGMQAQTIGAEQIKQALLQLSEATRQTVDSLRQSSQSIDELNLVSNGLRHGVSRFKVQA
ncbi:methyl-accepting chemotaxis protein [Crenobacter sp. SG2305]|uniref:methyl-accepting chemotaxis protein n=1 Tax=Crenobacter oryzisoli TaxID=3056844 RepID=UPI0025AAD045|nr:methyl-accepting chemotaxis protein [Crenobacter sp. SG2305]MDN0085180.1 methyl-accepting chemotaxis protein [Crenobacter sp. SG2305]